MQLTENIKRLSLATRRRRPQPGRPHIVLDIAQTRPPPTSLEPDLLPSSPSAPPPELTPHALLLPFAQQPFRAAPLRDDPRPQQCLAVPLDHPVRREENGVHLNLSGAVVGAAEAREGRRREVSTEGERGLVG